MAKLDAGMVQDGNALLEQTLASIQRRSGSGRLMTLAGE